MVQLLKIGDSMPPFTLEDAQGALVASDSLLGEGPLVIFFYPKDESAICTLEACSFRDQHQDFVDAGARVVGISRDSVESHAAFVAERRLPYTLLSDPQNATRRAFGIGSDVLGLVPGRVTFVVDSGGTIAAVTESALRHRKHVKDALVAARRLAGRGP